MVFSKITLNAPPVCPALSHGGSHPQMPLYVGPGRSLPHPPLHQSPAVGKAGSSSPSERERERDREKERESENCQ